MRTNNTVEVLIGAIVVAVAIGFMFFAYANTSAGGVSGYPLEAQFSSADGILSGTDVRLHGIKIGTVSNVSLDPKTFMAVIRMDVRHDVQIPDDSAIKVTSSGLLGNSYLSIQPGGSPKNLAAGAQIANTQGSVDIMGLIGRAIYGNTSSGASSSGSSATAPPAKAAPAAGDTAPATGDGAHP
jgi:phospholipid/cholesterol/gamma-HCH transport system substrate-binding protein